MKIISSDLLRGHMDTFILGALMKDKMNPSAVRRFIEAFKFQLFNKI